MLLLLRLPGADDFLKVAIIFIIYLGQIARFADAGPWGGTGAVEAGNVLSFAAAVGEWTTVQSNYNIVANRL